MRVAVNSHALPVYKKNRIASLLNSSCKIFRLNFFAITFLSSILAKCVRDESCRGEFPPTSPKGLVLVAQTDFCVYR